MPKEKPLRSLIDEAIRDMLTATAEPRARLGQVKMAIEWETAKFKMEEQKDGDFFKSDGGADEPAAGATGGDGEGDDDDPDTFDPDQDDDAAATAGDPDGPAADLADLRRRRA